MTDIPEDIMQAAEEIIASAQSQITIETIERATDGQKMIRDVYVTEIAKAILAERKCMEWQDIHTAPRDGTKVLCYSPGNKKATYHEPRYPHFCVDEYRGTGRSGFYKMWPEAPYTHWMPLPAAPKGGDE